MLTAAQIEARRGKLTGSRVACLMRGDAPAILRLYQEFIGEAEPEDLSHVWPVRLGEATEQLNLDWYERQNATPVTRRGEVAVHPTLPWAACTLDGWDHVLACPVEAKHVGGREPLEVVIDRYQPQMQWTMLVTQSGQVALSVIMGANPPVVEFIEIDAGYTGEMVERGRQFMACVAARRPPVVLAPVAAPIDSTKVYDMSQSNQWCDAAATWLDTRQPFEKCRDAEKILKSLVPADAKKAWGRNIQITRDRAGRLSLREVTP